MRPRIEIDPALGSVDPSQLEALVPGLGSLGDGGQEGEEAGLPLALLLEGLADSLFNLGDGKVNFYLQLSAALFTLIAVLAVSFWFHSIFTKRRKPLPGKALEQQRLLDRQRKIQELRDKERLMAESRAKGQPSSRKAPIQPSSSSAATQDLHTLARKGNVAGLRRLLERGANVEELSKESRKTSLHVACQYGQLNAAKMLVESFGSNIEARTIFGRTPLHLAAAQGFSNVVEYLVSRQADVTAITPDGASALDLSKKYSYHQVTNLLTNPPKP